MATKLSSFLKELSNQELHLFYFYRYNEFLPGSQAQIDAELRKRNLQLNITAKPVKLEIVEGNATAQCKKCGSTRFIAQLKTEIKVGKFARDESVYKEYKCSLCNKIY
ncbi:MAG: hypothetical protein WBP43_10330 [Chitinophagales bacterium]